VAGLLILIAPALLNYIVAIYLIVAGANRCAIAIAGVASKSESAVAPIDLKFIVTHSPVHMNANVFDAQVT